jgi:1-deoxy-D-xylulose-5-phosphate synthase
MLRYAIYDLSGPVFIRYPRGRALNSDIYVEKFEELQKIYDGEKVCILSVGHFLRSAADCAELLKKDKISAALFSVKQVKPLSKKIYSAIFKKYDYIVLCEENSLIGGYCSGVLEIAHELIEEGELKKLPRFVRIGYPDCFVEQGSAEELAKDLGMSPEAVAQKILTVLAERRL